MRGLIRTSPSTGSSPVFFLVVFLVVVVVVDLVWRVELRVARVDVVTSSASSSSARFLLDNIQHGVHPNRCCIPWMSYLRMEDAGKAVNEKRVQTRRLLE